jgi:mannose-6-phosphate isomerase-like protein (cupin superfamily)
MKTFTALLMTAACLATASSFAQAPQRPPSTSREDALDPSPVSAADPDLKMFLNDASGAKPRTAFGKLVYRDILTKLDTADKTKPIHRGAVLTGITAVSQVTLDPGATATGKMDAGNRQIFYTAGGTGQVTVNGKASDVKDGIGFILTPEFSFTLTNTGKTPLLFYVRSEALPADYKPDPNFAVVSRWNNDRRIGAHWMHICNGGPAGMNLCTVAPYTMPQPHSHPGEEVWLAVKGESILSLGKNLVRMHPGQAYKIPPTGLAAHSNFNLGAEPVELIYMGPAVRGDNTPGTADYARLDNSPINSPNEPNVDMYIGNWRDAYPRMAHGNIYMRDMLTALKGADPLHPTEKGAVLTNAEAVSYAMLEPNAVAHPLEGEFKGVQETFVVHSGTGEITVGGKKFALSKDKAFVLAQGMDFKMTATGENYLTFYVVTEKLAEGAAPKANFEVVDNSAKPTTVKSWYNQERSLIGKENGLAQYGAVTQVELKDMAMSRPYSNAPGTEEIWIATDGDVDFLLGKKLKKLPVGTAYRVPSTGITPHANINTSGKLAKFLYFVK